MNQTAIYILSAIDRALKATDPAEAAAEMKRARNLTEILGAQCDASEKERRYWCNEAKSIRKQMDKFKAAQYVIQSVRDETLWPRKRA